MMLLLVWLAILSITVFKPPFVDKNSLALRFTIPRAKSTVSDSGQNIALGESMDDSMRDGTISSSMLDIPMEDRDNKACLMREISLFRPFLLKIIDNIIV